jgi:hypothetical protein
VTPLYLSLAYPEGVCSLFTTHRLHFEVVRASVNAFMCWLGESVSNNIGSQLAGHKWGIGRKPELKEEVYCFLFAHFAAINLKLQMTEIVL